MSEDGTISADAPHQPPCPGPRPLELYTFCLVAGCCAFVSRLSCSSLTQTTADGYCAIRYLPSVTGIRCIFLS
ncbi:hypothetical protein WG66_000905, partial [Moniliophthora roreri]